MKILALIIGLLNSLALFSADVSSFFIRINEEKSTSEVAFRSYLSPDSQTTVQLIGIEHTALPSFYENVEKMLEDKVVLYEMVGGTLDDSARLNERIATLGTRYQTIYKAMERFRDRPDALGRISQQHLNYAKVKELIHADVGAESEISKTMNGNILVMSDVQLENMLDSAVHDSLKSKQIEVKDEQNDVAQFEVCLSQLPGCNSLGLSFAQRENIKQAIIDDGLLRRGQCPPRLKAKFGDHWQETCLGRNQFVFDALKNLWSRSNVPAQIIITYGACHMGFIEDFLLDNGYTHLNESDGWLVTANLVPDEKDVKLAILAPSEEKAKEHASMPVGNEIKKTIFSSDSSVKIYLIGNGESTSFGVDDFFLQRAALGFASDKELSQLNNGETLGVVYTTSNINFVEKQLLLNGFQTVKTEPFSRSNKNAINFSARVESIDVLLNYEISSL